MRGPAPQPIELRLLNGNPSRRPIPPTPSYDPLSPRPPAELPPEGRKLWRRLVKHLGQARVLRETDREALLVLCDLWAVYCHAMREARSAAVVPTRGRNAERAAVVVSPYWRVARDAAEQMMRLWARFGLTPSDRTRIMVEEGDDDTEFETLLRPAGG